MGASVPVRIFYWYSTSPRVAGALPADKLAIVWIEKSSKSRAWVTIQLLCRDGCHSSFWASGGRADVCQGRFRCIRDHYLAAHGKTFKADEVWQRRCNVGLTLDGCHRIFF